MKTDDLVNLLAAGVQPVPAGALRRRLATGLAAGLPVSVLIMLAGFGVRPDIAEAMHLGMFWAKVTLPALVAVAGLHAVLALSRPGRRAPAAVPLVAADLAFIWILAALALAGAAAGERMPLLLGESWSECPLNIALLSAPLFVATLWVVKGMAPTRPALAGAAAGLLASGMGTLVYTLHCPEMAAPFLAVWYVLGMALQVVAGALLGPRLLRW